MDGYVNFGGLALILLALNQLWTIDRRSRRTERNLMVLMAHLGVSGSEPPQPSDTVKALAADPRGKIAAIKAYRTETGLALVEAKEVVEKLMSPKPSDGA
jgi:ribosomal protein L7/L12